MQRTDRFFENEEIRQLLDRARFYARAGVCVHFCGPAGLGKTSLALRLAELLGRPVAFMAGNEWLSSRDFIGHEIGQSMSSVVDNYVQSVRRTEAETRVDWRDSALAGAMLHGYTFVYDEFTRATPEANSILLSVLEEGVLVSTDPASPRSYLQAHPDFRIVLTSNPHDYVGVNGAPDALLDRVVTLPISAPSERTMAGIVAMRSGLSEAQSRRIVALGATLSAPGEEVPCSLRAAILIARIAALKAREGGLTDDALEEIATDVFGGRGIRLPEGAIAAALARGRAA